MSDLLYSVFTDIEPEYEEDFNRWQDEEHCDLLLTLPDYYSVSRYESLDTPHRFVNFWHIKDMAAFNNPNRKVMAESEWGLKLSPYRHRRLDFYIQDGGIEMKYPKADYDGNTKMLLIETYSDELDKKNCCTDKIKNNMDRIKRIKGVRDIRIYHSYEGLGKDGNIVFYYLDCSQEYFLNQFIPMLEDIANSPETYKEKFKAVKFYTPKK